MENETMIQKKKSPLPIIIVIAAILIIAAVVCYFSFFSEAAIRAREIKAHIASAEKYLDDLDYENAKAEYEEVLKLDPQAENILNTYVDTVLTYADEVAESDPEKAADILSDASDFLDKISDGNHDIEKQAEELSDRADDYQAIADAEKETEEEPLVDEDDSENEAADTEDEDIAEEEYYNFSVSFEEVLVTCDGRHFDISLATDGIQDMYLMNSNDVGLDWLEYEWSVDFTTDGYNHLSVATLHFKSGDEEYYDDIYSMQHNLWELKEDGGASSVMYVDMKLDGNTIIWSFDLPEEYIISEEDFSVLSYNNTGDVYY